MMDPIQNSKKTNNYFKFKKKIDYKILKETKILHQKRKDFSKIQIIEFSLLYVILNHPEISSNKLEELSNIDFLDQKNQKLKEDIIKYILERGNQHPKNYNIVKKFKTTVEEINELSNVKLITSNKTEKDILDLLNELIQDHKDQSNLKKIESLEKKLINNLDENSYSELIKLKSQLNRD